MTDTYAFIGDIHGTLQPLVEIVHRAQHSAGTLVFLGDYVNRGSQSREVLDFLVDLAEEMEGRIHFLAGNHDLAFLDAITNDRLDGFLRIGGAATVSSYPRNRVDGTKLPLRERIPAAHVDFLLRLEPSFNVEDCFAMHDQADAITIDPGGYGVFGHRPQSSLEPLIANDFALIDTGCGTLPNGRLTSFLWPSRRWFQSS